eukprot:1154812-Ditylum_brightwellii.AAC.1
MQQQRREAFVKRKEAFMATAFVMGANKGKYGKLMDNLANDYLHGTNKYPKTMVAAYKLV